MKASIPFSTLSFLHSSFKFYFYVCSLTPSFSSAPAGHSTAGSFAGRQRDHSPGVRGTSSLNIGFFSIVIHDAYSSFFFFYARRPFHQGASLGGIVADPLRAGGRITAWGDDVGIARAGPRSMRSPRARVRLLSDNCLSQFQNSRGGA